MRTTVYLLFTTLHEAPGASATSGLTADAAIPMAAQLVALHPDDTESAGLHALLLLTEARRPGRFALQSGISGLHSARLGALIARSCVDGPETALTELEALAESVPTRQLAATRGDLLRRLGRHTEAIAAYEAAARLEPDPLLQDYLLRRAAEI